MIVIVKVGIQQLGIVAWNTNVKIIPCDETKQLMYPHL